MQENFSPRQSLLLIQSMIDKTKADISENRFYFLLWGWIAFTGIMGQFFLKVVLQYRHHYVIWLITIVGVIITMLHSKRARGKSRVRTYVGDNMSYLWSGMGVSFFVLSFIFSFVPVSPTGWAICYPFFIMLYGLGTFVSGRLLQFQPLVIGGMVNWVLACVTVFFSFDYQMLFAAAAVLTSYLIPGYMIKSEKHAG